MVKSQVVKTLKVDLRKIVIGLLFGSLLLIIPGILTFLIFEVFKLSDNNLPFLQILNNAVPIILINSSLGGFLGLVLFGFKSKLKAFLMGFTLAFITHSIVPLLLYIIPHITLQKNSLIKPVGFYQLLMFGPFIIGAILTNFFLPKEDFIPQKKNIIIVALIILFLYFFVDSYYRIKTKVETVPSITEIEVNEREVNQPREAFIIEEKDSIDRLPGR